MKFLFVLKGRGHNRNFGLLENAALTKSKSKYRALDSKVILGFHINSKLKWKFHIDNIAQKLARSIFLYW